MRKVVLALALTAAIGGAVLWWRRRQEQIPYDSVDEERWREEMGDEAARRAEEEAQAEEHPLPAEDVAPGGKVRKEVVDRLDQHAALFAEAAADSGIPAAWLKGIAAAESGGKAESGEGKSGYKGIMQAERSADHLDPAISIREGAQKVARFRASLKKHLGDDYAKLSAMDQLRVLATSYNAGPGTVYKAIDYARAAGDVGRWRDPEHYTRALIYYGAYSTGAYAPKGTPKEALAEAERWRKSSSRKDLSLQDLRAQGAPEIVIRAVEQKQQRTGPYLDKIVTYARHYEAPAVA